MADYIVKNETPITNGSLDMSHLLEDGINAQTMFSDGNGLTYKWVYIS